MKYKYTIFRISATIRAVLHHCAPAGDPGHVALPRGLALVADGRRLHFARINVHINCAIHLTNKNSRVCITHLSSPGTKIEMSGCSFSCAPSSSSRYTSRFSTASGNLVVKYFQLLANDPRFLIQSLVNTKDNIMRPQTEPEHHHPPPASGLNKNGGRCGAGEMPQKFYILHPATLQNYSKCSVLYSA